MQCLQVASVVAGTMYTVIGMTEGSFGRASVVACGSDYRSCSKTPLFIHCDMMENRNIVIIVKETPTTKPFHLSLSVVLLFL